MNTLPKALTGRFFTDPALFEALEARWSDLCRAASDRSAPEDQRPRLTATHQALYAALRGKDYRKGFTPITNAVRLANGQDPFMALKVVVYKLHETYAPNVERLLAPFGGLVTMDMLCALRELLPQRPSDWYIGMNVDEAFPGAALPVVEVAASA